MAYQTRKYQILNNDAIKIFGRHSRLCAALAASRCSRTAHCLPFILRATLRARLRFMARAAYRPLRRLRTRAHGAHAGGGGGVCSAADK
jgi:hypothetical protein